MDSTYYVMAFFVVIALALFLRYKNRAKVDIKGPGGTGMRMDASNDPTPAIKIEDAKSRKGGLRVEDNTERGADIRKIEVEKDIEVKSGNSDSKKA